MTAKVTVEEVERVAELAHLELTPEETGRMLSDLNAILDYVAELNELDTAGVVPLAQVSELVECCQRPACCARMSAALARSRSSDAAGAGDRPGLLQGAQGD